MDKLDELAGRIEGIGRALLRLSAELEMERLIDGPRLSAAWRAAVPDHIAGTPVLRSARTTLLDMARLLDEARQTRQSRRGQ